jgi:hypothetical protein
MKAPVAVAAFAPIFAAASFAALLTAAPVSAQRAGAAGEPKVSQLIVYGSDPCPAGTDDTIIVCARKPEGDRFRIPENLRSDPNDPGNQAWATRATQLETVGRSGIGSCSTVGPGGSIGCFNDIVRAARAERNSPDNVNWNLLVEQARKERLSKIDAQAAAVEAESQPPR